MMIIIALEGHLGQAADIEKAGLISQIIIKIKNCSETIALI